ncbi:MAG: hypothetical protein A2126_01720 [Candidatus Woykebacteria bacterium GWB1_45_5]|uniref:Methyltransferase domain-containing protein n=1 Tax=Candidatus Woykebacteria bacterium GWB1_45_5 TaxID=1802592 RepID=A0A1G1W6N0_9BACT|nr:MAG: hypothetical protein A2126_01720 [Candidatus Woykebacteria bacterium GWB1_45_5]
MSRYKSNINLKDKNNVLAQIYHRVRENSLVLDVGCAAGYFDKVLKEKKNCKIVGVEIDAEDAKKAESYCELVLNEDIEGKNLESKLTRYKFDHIIFADVLEHLINPGEVLVRVKRFLADTGSILISIPNIAHVSVRLELLSGKFIPEKIGILDNTHLRYFTKESFSDLVRSSGYKVKWLSQSSFDFPEVMIKKFLDELGIKPSKKIMTTLSSPDSIAHQYIFEIVPADKNVKIDRMNEKPIYVVRGFLRSIEEDHEKFKRDEIKYIKSVEEELKVIKSSLAYKIYEKENKIRRWLRGMPRKK